MLRALKNELRLSGRGAAMPVMFTLGAYAVGWLLLAIILRVEAESEFFPMGSVMAIAMGLFGTVVYDGLSFSSAYSLSVAMGRRRLPKIAAHAMFLLLRMLVISALLCLFMQLDTLLAGSIFAGRGVELELWAYVTPGLAGAYVFAAVVLSLLVAAVRLRFGTRGWVIMYFIVLFGGMLVAKLVELVAAHPDDPVAGALIACFTLVARAMTPALAALLAAAVGVLILLFSVCLMLRAAVVLE